MVVVRQERTYPHTVQERLEVRLEGWTSRQKLIAGWSLFIVADLIVVAFSWRVGVVDIPGDLLAAVIMAPFTLLAIAFYAGLG